MCKGVVSCLATRVKCDICHKQFVNNSVLKKHIIAIHKNAFFFTCKHPGCERTFRTGYRLYVHELYHKGLKPFKCNYCDKAFAEKGTLKVHLRSHSSICYYNCEYCPYGCKTESHLREHYKIKHNKFDFYKCEECGRHFNLKSDYRFHLADHILHKRSLLSGLNSTIDTDVSLMVGKQNEWAIVNEISFGVYVI